MGAPAPARGFFESLSVAGLIATYGVFLIVGGAWGAITTGALHSLYMGAACGLLVLGCAFLASFSGDAKMVSAGVHADLLFALLFGGVFALQAYKAYGDPRKADRFPLFVVLVAGSASHLVAMVRMKPKKQKAEKDKKGKQ